MATGRSGGRAEPRVRAGRDQTPARPDARAPYPRRPPSLVRAACRSVYTTGARMSNHPLPTTLRLLLAAALSLGAGTAAAAPADRRIELAPGETRIERFGAPAHLYVDRLDIVRAELLPSEEVLLETLGTGTATLFFHGDGWLRVWRIYVGTAPDPAARAAALAAVQKACSGARLSEPPFQIRITDRICHEKTVALGAHALVEEIELTFDAAGLRAQIEAQEGAIRAVHPELASLRLFYLGGTLGIEGTVPTTADLEAVVRAAWSKSAGRLLLDLSKVKVENRDDAAREAADPATAPPAGTAPSDRAPTIRSSGPFRRHSRLLVPIPSNLEPEGQTGMRTERLVPARNRRGCGRPAQAPEPLELLPHPAVEGEAVGAAEQSKHQVGGVGPEAAETSQGPCHRLRLLVHGGVQCLQIQSPFRHPRTELQERRRPVSDP